MAKENRGGRQHSGKAGTQGEESLISLKGHDEEVEQILEVQRDFAKEYGPELNLEITVSNERVNGKSGPDYLGFFSYLGGRLRIVIRRDYLDTQTMNDEYDECVRRGFHPPRGRKSGIEATVAHEFGHYLTFLIAGALAPAAYSGGIGVGSYDFEDTASEIIKEVSQHHYGTSESDRAKFRSKISVYAQKSDGEAIAEAVCDVYCNGESAAEESQRIVREIKKIYGKRNTIT